MKSALCSGQPTLTLSWDPAWRRAQVSHHALPRSGGDPASTAFWAGRSSLGAAVSRTSIAHIRGPHPELQKLWAALCLPRRAAEREGYLQAEVAPLDSECHSLTIAYQSQGEPCPLGVRAHSTRSYKMLLRLELIFSGFFLALKC